MNSRPREPDLGLRSEAGGEEARWVIDGPQAHKPTSKEDG